MFITHSSSRSLKFKVDHNLLLLTFQNALLLTNEYGWLRMDILLLFTQSMLVYSGDQLLQQLYSNQFPRYICLSSIFILSLRLSFPTSHIRGCVDTFQTTSHLEDCFQKTAITSMNIIYIFFFYFFVTQTPYI